MFQDIRNAIRSFYKTPAFALLIVFTLALGIAANTTVFSAVNAVLLESLPFREPERVVMVYEKRPKENNLRNVVAPADFFDWREQNQVFSHMAALSGFSVGFSGGPEPERISAQGVSSAFFDVAGVPPALGRGFLPEEETPGKNRVVVLTHGFWQRRLGGKADVIGATITLDGNPFPVVGVLPAQFSLPNSDAEIYFPLAFSAEGRNDRGMHQLNVMARLKPGVSITQAQTEMDALAARIEQANPAINRGHGANVVAIHDSLVDQIRPTLLVMQGAVGFVLLIACANAANLLLARAETRRREMSIRMALGAGRSRLMRQLLTESLLLALAAGVSGALLALWGVDLMRGLIPKDLNIYGLDALRIDGGVLAFTVAASALTGLVFGLLPALESSRVNANETLKEGSRTSTGGGRRWLRSSLVVAEVALSISLLAGAGLLLRSFWNLQQVSPGFRTEKLLTLRTPLSGPRYRENTAVRAFYTQLLDRVRVLPGVERAGLISHLPVSGQDSRIGLGIKDVPSNPNEPRRAHYRVVSPGYFETMGVVLRQGRLCEQRDATGPPVLIINETAARKFFPEGKALGAQVRYGAPDWREVIGIVSNVRHWGLDVEPRPEAYLCDQQALWRGMNIVVRTHGDPAALAGAVRAEIRALDSEQAVLEVRTMEQVISRSISLPRFYMTLLGTFAGVALLLAAAGIYGVMAYSVAQRTPEIGLRMALGAQTRDVLRQFTRQGMLLAGIGVALGLAGALGLTRLLEGLLFGVKANDWPTYAAVATVLGLVALLASWLPARRATKVDPMVALRFE